MATAAQMMMAGIAYVVCTFTLIWCAYIGDKIFKPILTWYYSFQYASPPPLDPGMMTWVFPMYYGLIIIMWIALTYALFSTVMSRVTYPYGG